MVKSQQARQPAEEVAAVFGSICIRLSLPRAGASVTAWRRYWDKQKGKKVFTLSFVFSF